MALDVRQRAKPIVFQLEEPVRMIEWLGNRDEQIGRYIIVSSSLSRLTAARELDPSMDGYALRTSGRR